jgi:hypothetical protein
MSSFVCCALHLHNVLLVTHSVSVACQVLGDAELWLLFLKANRCSVYLVRNSPPLCMYVCVYVYLCVCVCVYERTVV